MTQALAKDEEIMSRRQLVWCVVLVALTGVVPVASIGSSITVPDDVVTVQEAVDVGVDTVFVRAGSYGESLVISRPVALIGVSSAELPIINAVNLVPQGETAFEPVYLLERIAVAGEVDLHNSEESCNIVFHKSKLIGGMRDLSSDLKTLRVSWLGCDVGASLDAKVRVGAYMESTTVSGGGLSVSGDEAAEAIIRNSMFVGSGGMGVLVDGIANATVDGCTVSGYATGVHCQVYGVTWVTRSDVSDCVEIGINASNEQVRVIGNDVSGCGNGIVASGIDVVVDSNMVARSDNFGVIMSTDYVGRVKGNIIERCGGDGLQVGGSGLSECSVANNTLALNGGSGLVALFGYDPADGYCEVVRNIGYGNAVNGVRWQRPHINYVSCNDWFGNGENVVGRPFSVEDVSMDPGFCDTTTSDYHLQSGSPLRNNETCGVVGAVDGNCVDTLVTSTSIERFTLERTGLRIVVSWRVGGATLVESVVLQRAEAPMGPWSRPITERAIMGREVRDVDESISDAASYWYRLLSREGMVMAGPLGAAALVDGGEKLRVGPNPTWGRSQVEFRVERAGPVSVEVFDIQGRSIASLASGVWPVGTHKVAWFPSGDARVAAGIYVVRFRYPGGEELRRLVVAG